MVNNDTQRVLLFYWNEIPDDDGLRLFHRGAVISAVVLYAGYQPGGAVGTLYRYYQCGAVVYREKVSLFPQSLFNVYPAIKTAFKRNILRLLYPLIACAFIPARHDNSRVILYDFRGIVKVCRRPDFPGGFLNIRQGIINLADTGTTGALNKYERQRQNQYDYHNDFNQATESLATAAPHALTLSLIHI